MDTVLLGIVLVIGTIVFFIAVSNSVVFNPSLQGYFSWWLGCVVGTTVVLYVLAMVFSGIVGWIIDFVKDYYKYIIGGVVILVGLGYFAGQDKKSTKS